jgi:succinoglycan biosynthesis protein ExoO
MHEHLEESRLVSAASRSEIGTPVASVVIPAYNAAATIEMAIVSVLEQSLTSLEVLVVDDCSTDDTRGVVAALCRADPRLSLLRTPINLGPGGARRHAFERASGRWIAVLDADDRFAADRLRRLTAFADRVGADLVADNLLLVLDEASTELQPMLDVAELREPLRVSAADYLLGNLPRKGRPHISYGFLKPVFRAVFLRDNALGYRPEMRFAEDFIFCLECLVAGANCWLIDDALYYYRIHDPSLTARHGARELGMLHAIEAGLVDHPRVTNDPELRRALHRHLRSIERRLNHHLCWDAVRNRDLLGLICHARANHRTYADYCEFVMRSVWAKVRP